MSGWLRFENTTAENPKLTAVSDRAFRLWFACCCYCSRNETNGLIPAHMITRLSPSAKRPTVNELIDGGLLEAVSDSYYVHDYLKHNPSRERLQEMRSTTRSRVAGWREKRAEDGETPGCNAVTSDDLYGVTSRARTDARGSRDRSVDVPSRSSLDSQEESRADARAADQHPEAARLSHLLADLIRGHDPKASVSPSSDRWVRDMRLLLADRGDAGEVEQVIRWSQQDSFWQSNVLSPGKLRKQFTRLLLRSRSGDGNGSAASAPERDFSEYDRAAGL